MAYLPIQKRHIFFRVEGVKQANHSINDSQ